MNHYHKTKNRRNFYAKKMEEFHGCCEICGEKQRLVIDHNHQTKEMRGLLCYAHNAGLGMFNDSPDLLEKAAKYLRDKGFGYSLQEPKEPTFPTAQKDTALDLLTDASFKSDRDRARELTRKFGGSLSRWATRLSRLRKKLHHVTCKPSELHHVTVVKSKMNNEL